MFHEQMVPLQYIQTGLSQREKLRVQQPLVLDDQGVVFKDALSPTSDKG